MAGAQKHILHAVTVTREQVETRKMKTERVKKVCPMCSELGDDKHVI